MNTVLEIIKKTTDFFTARGVENARFNAEWLVGQALGLKRMQLYVQFERLLTEPELEKIRPLVRRRAAHEPLQYVLGETPFAGLTLKCDPRGLIPRPETEYLVEMIGAKYSEAAPPASVLDLGTGTGALALALAGIFPSARVTGTDLSDAALALAQENAAANGLTERVRWLKSNWFAQVPANERFDLIVSNPPYLTPQEWAETKPEVRDHEPRTALVGGADGLDDLRSIVAEAPRWLASGGTLVLETGIAQHAALRSLVEASGLTLFESRPDLTGRDRFVWAVKA